MGRVVSYLLFAGLCLASPICLAQDRAAPAPPSATIPPPKLDEPPPPPPAANEPAAAEALSEPVSPISITLGAKSETITPGKIHDGLAKDGKITVESPKPDTVTVLIGGVAAAHCFVGFHSAAVYSFQVTQEFDVVSSDPNVNQTMLTLESALNGYVRTKSSGAARMSLASVSLSPAGGPPIVAIRYPSLAFAGGRTCAKYEREMKPPSFGPLPLGRYVIRATFQLDAGADGIGCARGVADFSPDGLPDTWKQVKDPFKDVDRANFGFATTVIASAPGAGTQARRSKNESVPAPRIAQTGHARPSAQPHSAIAASSFGRSLGR